MNRFAHLPLALFILFFSSGTVRSQSAAENTAAFNGSASLTQESFHWDSLGGSPPSPQVATTPRSNLSSTTLTNLSWNPSQPGIYQEKMIGGNLVQATLVATFTQPFSMWNSAPGTDLTLTFEDSGVTNYIMPYVTSGNRLRDYLQENYFTAASTPDSASVALRIQQAVGLAPGDASTHGLAFFWAPLDAISRPAYSGDISAQLPTLGTFSDGTYQPTDVNAPTGFNYVDVNDSTKLYTGANGLSEFVEWNQAQTTYPWTAMGWTYNWNALQDGSNPLYGFDPLHVDSPIGLSEFVVSGGSEVLTEDWIPFAELGSWVLVPEVGTVWIPFVVVFAVFTRRRRRG